LSAVPLRMAKTTLSFLSMDNTYSFSSLSRFSSFSLSAVPLRMAKTTLSFLYLLILFSLPLLQLQLVSCSVENGKDDPLLSLYGLYLLILFPLPLLQLELISCSVENGEGEGLPLALLLELLGLPLLLRLLSLQPRHHVKGRVARDICWSKVELILLLSFWSNFSYSADDHGSFWGFLFGQLCCAFLLMPCIICLRVKAPSP
jgi:hypothetical protein